jgi:hypothetical protein
LIFGHDQLAGAAAAAGASAAAGAAAAADAAAAAAAAGTAGAAAVSARAHTILCLRDAPALSPRGAENRLGVWVPLRQGATFERLAMDSLHLHMQLPFAREKMVAGTLELLGDVEGADAVVAWTDLQVQ